MWSTVLVTTLISTMHESEFRQSIWRTIWQYETMITQRWLPLHIFYTDQELCICHGIWFFSSFTFPLQIKTCGYWYIYIYIYIYIWNLKIVHKILCSFGCLTDVVIYSMFILSLSHLIKAIYIFGFVSQERLQHMFDIR